MRILLLSDMHGDTVNIEKLAGEFGKADLVLFAGDFADVEKNIEGKPVLETLLKKHESIFAVLGNNDKEEFLDELEKQDISVEGSMVFHDSLVLAGSGGGSKFTGVTPFERTDEELVSDLNIIENSADTLADADGKINNLILIMHNPPKDTLCDLAGGKFHVGSEGLRQFIEKRQPVLVLTGHIHESFAVDKIGDTTVVNPGALVQGRYAVAELDKKDDKWFVKSAELFSLS